MHLSRETNDGLISPKTKVGNWTIVFEYLLQVLSRGWCLPPKCIAQCEAPGTSPARPLQEDYLQFLLRLSVSWDRCRGGPSGMEESVLKFGIVGENLIKNMLAVSADRGSNTPHLSL